MRRLFMPILMVVCSIAAAADDPARHAPQKIATRIGTLEFTHGFANGYPTEAYFDRSWPLRDFEEIKARP
jgi:hypothetical protein